jgi:hypothetical protein
LISKALGNEWGLPIIQFDPSRIFSSRVGESEHNIRRVLQVVENIAPCLDGTTRITLEDGRKVSIKELYKNQYRGEVPSMVIPKGCVGNFSTGKSSVILITKKESEDLYNIRTSIGTIRATGNHKFPILDSNGNFHWVEVKNLSWDDYIVCPKQVKTSKKAKGISKNFQENIDSTSKNSWFLNPDFFFARINKIEEIPGKHDVYDLCLNKNHNFIANGMFTHNCILFIDEIEKGFAGSHSSTFSDSGVTARVIGTFLVWMQECTKPVFTIATSNNIQYLPPEMISRFNETFFVNLPQQLEREEIFKIHLKKLGRDPSNFNLPRLATAGKDLSGREIEQALGEAMYEAFHAKKDISTEVIIEVLDKKTNLITTMAEQLKYLLDWVGWDPVKKNGIRARFAHPVEETSIVEVRDQIDKLISEVSQKKGDQGLGLGPAGSGPTDPSCQ